MKVLIQSRVRTRTVKHVSITMVPHPAAAIAGFLGFVKDATTGGASEAFWHNVPTAALAMIFFAFGTGKEGETIWEHVESFLDLSGTALAVSIVTWMLHGLLVAFKKRRVAARRQKRGKRTIGQNPAQLDSNSAEA